jgi:hypothetical protein
LSNFKDLTNQKFGRLTVVEYVKSDKYGNTYWKCKCRCNNEVIVRRSNLMSGDTQSCGCLALEIKSLIASQKKNHNKYDLSGEYGIGYTYDERKFYFDLEDYNLIKDYSWHFNKYGYIVTKGPETNNKTLFMHRLIMNAQENEDVDHIKHKKYDNRKSELRKVTDSQNLMNQELSIINTSGYKGISWSKSVQKWHVYINKDKKRYHLGHYEDINNAITARKQAEEKLFGKYSYDNSMNLQS